MLDSLVTGIPFLTGGVSTFVILIIVILVIYLVTSLIGKPFNLSLGPLKLNFSGGQKTPKKDDKKDPKKLQCDPECTVAKTKRQLAATQIKSLFLNLDTQCIELKYDTLRRQLNYVEEKLGDIKSIMSETYSELLKTKLPDKEKDNVKLHREYKQYQMILRIAMNECVVTLLKKCFKINHFSDMNVVEWDKYIQHKTDTAIQQISEFIDIMYGDYFLVSRQELSDGNDLHVDKFRVEMRDIFQTAKDIQIKNYTKMKQLKKQLDDEVQNIIEYGVN